MANPLWIAVLVISLTGCAKLSVIDTRSPTVPASVMALCPDLNDPSPGASIEQQWRMWGDDRQSYRDCQSLNAAKAATIEALTAKD